MIWRMHLLRHEVRSRVLRVIVDHLSLAKRRWKNECHLLYLQKNSNACIFHPLRGIDLKPACIIAAGASMSFLRAAFRAPGITTMKRVLLSEVFLSFWRIPFDNFCFGYLWYLQRQPPCRDGTSKQGFVHDPDLNQYFVIEVGIVIIILLCISRPFLLIFESQTSKNRFFWQKTSRSSISTTCPRGGVLPPPSPMQSWRMGRT